MGELEYWEATGTLVPLMAPLYIATGLDHNPQLPFAPHALKVIFTEAFNAQVGFGALIGQPSVMELQRCFSNEAGLASAPIAAAAANQIILQAGTGFYDGYLLDTIIVCSITGISW